MLRLGRVMSSVKEMSNVFVQANQNVVCRAGGSRCESKVGDGHSALANKLSQRLCRFFSPAAMVRL